MAVNFFDELQLFVMAIDERWWHGGSVAREYLNLWMA
jgi:hypothetical protein